MRQPYKRKSICHAEPKETLALAQRTTHSPISVRPFVLPSVRRPHCLSAHNCLQDIAQIQLYFFYALRFLTRKCCSALQMYVFITAACIKKEQGAKIIKHGAGGKGECTTTAAVATTRAEIALTLQAARSTREKIEKHSQHTKHFLHTDTNRLCVRECVCGLVYFFVYIFDCFARAFAISFAATLASAAALWVSVVQLLQAIPRSLTARQRRTGQIRGLNVHSRTHTHTHGQADRSDTAQDLY